MSEEAILGIDLGGSQVRVGKVRGGELERQSARRIPGQERQQAVLDEIFRAIDEVVDGDVVGIGCGVPSVVDVARGVVYSVENIPSWQEVPLGAELESRYGVPAHINNDANSFAVGELYFGEGRGRRNLVGLTLGTGLGAGVVIDGRLYAGSNCAAGEIGNLPYRDRTLESFCSGAFFQQRSGRRGDEIFAAARRGEAEAIGLYDEFGFELGFAVLLALYAYDPEIVVLGGSVSRAFPFFEKGLRARLEQYAFRHLLDRIEIAVSRIDNAAVLGAAALYLDARAGARRDSAPHQ